MKHTRTVHLKTNRSSLHTTPFLDSTEIQTLLSTYTENSCPLEENPSIIVYGKNVNVHRRVGFFSDQSEGYKFSGQLTRSLPMTPELQKLLEKVNATLGTAFNGILVNHYRDGSDYIGAHSDSKIGLSNGVVAAISVGATRKFRIRDKSTNKIVIDVPTTPGELLVMDGEFQNEFKHEVPIEKRVKGDRISFTFRKHTAL